MNQLNEMAFEEKVKYFKNNYREYLELVIAMELGLSCKYFQLSQKEKDELYYKYMKSDNTIFDTCLLLEIFG